MTTPKTPEDIARDRKLDQALDQELDNSFPASDPPSITQPPDPDGDEDDR
ncbi:hypothetical protein [Brevundimonas aveniformis]|nr:hypothetical protein [Brevundimonas aveniformis]